MHTLFNLMSSLGQGVLKAPGWNYVREGLQRNITTVLRYYRRNPTAVESNHFLVKLLHSISFPLSYTLERYYNNVDAASFNVASALKITTSINSGHVFDGIFYGKGNKEIIVGNDESFDLTQANLQWQNLCPVRVLRHPRSDLGLNLLDGTHPAVETGLCVISINIAMLAIQYRAFRINEAETNGAAGESELSVMHFIRMYVLPNMLFSHLDVAIFNRMNALHVGAPFGQPPRQHSFYLIDYSERVTGIQKTLLDNLTKQSHDFAATLRSIPAVFKEDMVGVMELPEIAPTRQVLWALVISQLPLVDFLIRVAKETPGTRNRAEINRILKNVSAYKSDNLMHSMLPYEYYYDVQDTIDDIVSRIN